jgi:hypothetical protein
LSRPLPCRPYARREVVVERSGEVCLAEEAERLRRSGLGVDEIARRMGVDVAWVETVVMAHEGDEEPGPEND